MRKLVAVVAALAALVFVADAPRADAAAARRHSADRPIRHARTNDTEYSVNWSGYAVPAKAGEQITAVNGSWIVPLIRNAPPGFSASWIGIGGYRSSDLIQTGTASSGRLEGDYAWYEILPANETAITSGCYGDSTCTVSQGDRISAAVWHTGGTGWAISMTDYADGGGMRWTWSKGLPYQSSMSSAEWVFEAPTISAPFTPIGIQTLPAYAPHAKFLGGSTYQINGATRPLGGSGASRMIMVDLVSGWYRTATPSMLGGDGHFTVCAYKRTCPNF